MSGRVLHFSDMDTGDFFRVDGYGEWLFMRLSHSAYCFNTKSTLMFTSNPEVEKYVGDFIIDDRDFKKYKE